MQPSTSDARVGGVLNQEKLRNAKVVVIGAGGVKSSLLYCLTAAGIGHIMIIDFDTVDLSNLNRQILYDDSSRPKKRSRGHLLVSWSQSSGSLKEPGIRATEDYSSVAFFLYCYL
ncbi:MAG: ThiF family adenylyltransferase [Candidatus Paceibacterota bacterium]